MKKTSFLIALIFLSSLNASAATLKIQFLFDDFLHGSAYFTPVTREVFAESIASELEQLLDDSGLDSNFAWTVDHTPVVWDAGPGTDTPQKAVGFLKTDPQMSAVRGDADVQIMFVAMPLPYANICGFASDGSNNGAIPDSIAVSNRDMHAYAVITISPLCEPGYGSSTAHELGHLLYAEHQVNADGDEEGTPPKNDIPKPYNHGYKQLGPVPLNPGDPTPVYDTIMVSPINIQNVPLFFSDNLSSESDVVRLIDDDSWGVVSLYREPPPPDCTLVVQPQSCDSAPFVNYSATATLPEPYDILNVDIDVRIGQTGVWTDIYEGVFTCPSYTTVFQSLVRAFVQTQFGDSSCEVLVIPPNCPPDGDDDNPPRR